MTSTLNHLSRLVWLLAVAAAPAALAAPPWQQIVNPGPVVGMDGKPHQARCSGYPGTDPKFSFWTRRTASKNVVVYFEGGGACWDTLTCSSPQNFYQPQVPGTDPATLDGIFSAVNPSNPVRDWNMVYIPYCTGDIHLGSATKVHPSVSIPGLGTLPPITIEHRGFDNFMVVLDWIRKNFEAPTNLLVTGVSAGGYGATANAAWIARAFPTSHMSVLADASQGVTLPSWDKGDPGRKVWNPQLAPWVFGPSADNVPGPQLMRSAARGQPKAKFAQFTTVFDETQIMFYGAMKLCHLVSCDPQALGYEWYSQMVSQLIADQTQVPNFRSYVAYGSYHVILDQPQFYLENTGGPVFSSWLAQMLSNRGGRDGSGGQWFSASCPGCIPAH
jgi:hypothetical protein